MNTFFKGPGNLRRLFLGALALCGLALFAGVGSAKADDGCQRRIAKADYKVHEAVERHGWYSRQADHWRHELHEARERCWRENRRWWDEDGHRWRSDRDWDDHDHDHDHWPH